MYSLRQTNLGLFLGNRCGVGTELPTDEARAKIDLANAAALETEANRKAAAKAKKIKTTHLANIVTSMASQAAALSRKSANKRQNTCSDSEDDCTIVSQGNQKYVAIKLSGPPEITSTITAATFNLAIWAICPHIEDNKHTNGDTGRLVKDDALFVMQRAGLDNSEDHTRKKK